MTPNTTSVTATPTTEESTAETPTPSETASNTTKSTGGGGGTSGGNGNGANAGTGNTTSGSASTSTTTSTVTSTASSTSGGKGNGIGGRSAKSKSSDSSSAPSSTSNASSPSPSPTSSSRESTASGTGTGAGRGIGWFNVLTLLNDGDVELRALRSGDNWDSFCGGAPVLVTKSLMHPENKNCIDGWTNLSCTCLSDLQDPATSWEIHVTKLVRENDDSGIVPNTTMASGGATVAITTIGTFGIPAALTTLYVSAHANDADTGFNLFTPSLCERVWNRKIIGESAVPLDLQWDFNFVSTQSTAIARAHNASALTTVCVTSDVERDLGVYLGDCEREPQWRGHHIRVSSIDIGRHVRRTQWLNAALDLSGNRMTTFVSNIPQQNGSQGGSTIKELYLQGNPIANFSITASQFAQLEKLSIFRIDAASTTASIPLACTGSGQLKRVGATQFCVLPDPATNTTATNVSSHTNKTTVLCAAIGIPVGVLATVILVVLRRRRSTTLNGGRHSKNRSPVASLLACTTSRDYSILIVDDSLVTNPLIMMNRIAYREIAIKGSLNRGGFGVVYRGVYRNRNVAVKKIRAEFSSDIPRVEAFLREICLIASLDHPRIVAFVGVAWDTLQNLSAVTEFMAQGDLRDVLQHHKSQKQRQSQQLTWESHKGRIALHVAEALVYLHSLAPTVIHRDLKSKNVLLDEELNAKLSDFGISRECTIDDTHLTVGIGTSFWIAPEVLLGKPYDERADVFSFGIVLSEIDTEEYPYWNSAAPGELGNQEQAILRLVAHGDVRPQFSPSCPAHIVELAEWCLQGDPADRPTSTEVVVLLERFLNGAASSDDGSLSSFSSSSQAPPPSVRRPQHSSLSSSGLVDLAL
ncbi:Tkl protein kinase, partial [Globisporangium splendens]